MSLKRRRVADLSPPDLFQDSQGWLQYHWQRTMDHFDEHVLKVLHTTIDDFITLGDNAGKTHETLWDHLYGVLNNDPAINYKFAERSNKVRALLKVALQWWPANEMQPAMPWPTFYERWKMQLDLLRSEYVRVYRHAQEKSELALLKEQLMGKYVYECYRKIRHLLPLTKSPNTICAENFHFDTPYRILGYYGKCNQPLRFGVGDVELLAVIFQMDLPHDCLEIICRFYLGAFNTSHANVIAYFRNWVRCDHDRQCVQITT